MTESPSPAVDALVYQMESAFAGEFWHSVLRNLGSCTADDWDWTPLGGRRTIREIVKRIGVCKLRWQNQMFGDHQLVLADFLAMVEPHASGDPDRLLAWLEGVHNELQANVAALTDDDLSRVRPGTRPSRSRCSTRSWS